MVKMHERCIKHRFERRYFQRHGKFRTYSGYNIRENSVSVTSKKQYFWLQCLLYSEQFFNYGSILFKGLFYSSSLNVAKERHTKGIEFKTREWTRREEVKQRPKIDRQRERKEQSNSAFRF